MIAIDERKIAFAEVYDIIKHSDLEVQNKISKKFIELLENCMDKSYEVNIDYTKELKEPNIHHETKVIMGIIYRDYLCSSDEKERLLKLENDEYSKIKKELEEKYSYDNLFKNNKPIENSIIKIEDNNKVIKHKELKWYQKILNKIKLLFNI